MTTIDLVERSASNAKPPELFGKALDYLQLFHQEQKTTDQLTSRLTEIQSEIEETNTYQQTYEELELGARVAWRNSTRCTGRLHWKTLSVRDMRHLTTAESVFEALVEHIKLATNGGKLRSIITVFAQQIPGRPGIRIWNPQLIRYAGYQLTNGRVIGDPAQVSLTNALFQLGWDGGRGTPFDILPLVIQMPKEKPKLFELPPEVVIEVPISHPSYPWFADLGLKWHALPAVSNMLLEVGGISYTAAPFNGWYQETEIGARNLSDEHRYNMLPIIADKLGLDRRRDRTLWKDRALVELNIAVLHSFAEAGVSIVDHHTAARQFTVHAEKEKQAGRCLFADWGWVVPPMSGSTTPTFHKEYENTILSPNFFSQVNPWEVQNNVCPIEALVQDTDPLLLREITPLNPSTGILEERNLAERRQEGTLLPKEGECPHHTHPDNQVLVSKRRAHNRSVVVLSSIILLLLLLAGLLVGLTSVDSTRLQVPVGQITFESSGQVDPSSSTGINDVVTLSLQHISTPEPGKSYSVWLLPDPSDGNMRPLLLSKLAISGGKAQLTYTHPDHLDLLATYSGVMIAEKSNGVKTAPPLDSNASLFVGSIPTIPTPGDEHHFSLLDHIRHLLAKDPTLQQLGLQGGLGTWLDRNAEKILEWSTAARDSWAAGEQSDLVHRHLLRILEYLDGTANVFNTGDIPPGSPLLVDQETGRIGLLEVAPTQPPAFLTHVAIHLQGVINAPGHTQLQTDLAIKIDAALNRDTELLQQVRKDARQLVQMDDEQLQGNEALSLLNDLVFESEQAYIGQSTTDGNINGIAWINHALQNLATLSIQTGCRC